MTAFFEAHPLRLFRTLFGLISPTTELQLASFFREFGPFIAIGKPGEQLATIGADRVFVGNDEWQKVVTDFLSQSRYVVLQAAGTEGFVWELHTVLETVPPEKLLFCLSNFRERQNDYEDFRLRAESTPGWRFPRSVGNLNEAQFLFFDSNRAPILHAISYRSPIRWMFLGQAADIRHTLARFIDRTDTTHARVIERRSHGLILAWFSDWGSPILRRLRFYVVASNGVVACPQPLLKQLPITLQKLQTLVPIAASITR